MQERVGQKRLYGRHFQWTNAPFDKCKCKPIDGAAQKVNKSHSSGSLLSKSATQSWFWSNISGILDQILDIRVSICSWDIGLHSGNILITIWVSKTSSGPSKVPEADVGRHILNSKSSFLNKIRILESLEPIYRCGVIYWAFVGLLCSIMASWCCWSFYAAPSINWQNS